MLRENEASLCIQEESRCERMQAQKRTGGGDVCMRACMYAHKKKGVKRNINVEAESG